MLEEESLAQNFIIPNNFYCRITLQSVATELFGFKEFRTPFSKQKILALQHAELLEILQKKLKFNLKNFKINFKFFFLKFQGVRHQRIKTTKVLYSNLLFGC